ncbi:MAG: hypothetical protein HYT39_04120 [Candidatus Sungbacteria bacterium]|nr:hypothetical protein [Candidatus Sungbacteria bacterium]
MRWYLSQLSGIIFLAGFVPYIMAIVRRQAQPMKASWLIWMSLDGLTLAGMYAKHSVNGQIVGATMGAVVVFFLSLKYGKPGWTRVDQWSLVGAVIGIGLWWGFDSPVLGILMAQVTGLVGAIPTFVNVWRRPQDEPRFGWCFFWASCLPALLAIPAISWEHTIQPLGFLTGNSIMMYLLFIHRPVPHPRAVRV